MQRSNISPTGDTDLPQLSRHDDSASGAPSMPSIAEAMFYYSGLRSSTRLVYRTEPMPWAMPTGPKAYRRSKELRPVFGHKLNVVWKDLGPKVCHFLDSQGVLWTSIDVVRSVTVGEAKVGPVVLWIGIIPETLLGENACASANGCLYLLKELVSDDVEVEFLESIYTRSTGPNLLEPSSYLDPDVNVRGPLTPALGLSIAAPCHTSCSGYRGYLSRRRRR